MKLYHFSLCFLIVAAIALEICYAKVTEEKRLLEDKTFFNHTVSKAVDSSAKILAGAGPGGIEVCRDAAYEAFVNTIAAEMDIMGNPQASEELSFYIPVFAVMDENEIFINYCEMEDKKDLSDKCSRRTWADPISRDDVAVEKALQHYCNDHNKIAEAFGIDYVFSMPTEEGRHFVRSSEGLLVFALFQGYPIGTVSGHHYNRFAYSGCGIKLQNKYYVDLDENKSKLIFHAEGCSYLSDISEVYYSRKEAAMRGAYECSYCLGE